MAMTQDPIEDGGTYHRKKAYFSGLFFREYPPKIWPEKWYSTSILGSWRSPIEKMVDFVWSPPWFFEDPVVTCG